MTAWIQNLVAQLGYVGIALLMFAETVFPPLPSEVIMPLAGMQAGAGRFSLAGTIAAGVTGAMIGNLAWYALARAIGVERMRTLVDLHGRWLTLDWDEVERGRSLFAKSGATFVCLGRLVPTIRSIVSIPAGLLAMPLLPFLLWSLIGTTVWTGLLAGAGTLLGGRHGAVADVVGPVSTAIVVAIVGWYGWRVATWHRRKGSRDE